MGGKKKYINIFGSFTEPFNYHTLNTYSSQIRFTCRGSAHK